jgi:hypothetical protein
MKYGREYILGLASAGLTLLDREYEGFYAADARRWTQANPDLGLPLHLVRRAEAEAHRGSRRVGPPAQRSWLRRILRFLCSRS